MTGKLEETNENYSIAKIAGYQMCDAYNKQYKTNFICLMPTNLYGPNDNYNLKTSHFFPALISKIHFAKKNKKKFITIWGDGSPKRCCGSALGINVNELMVACGIGKLVNPRLINMKP